MFYFFLNFLLDILYPYTYYHCILTYITKALFMLIILNRPIILVKFFRAQYHDIKHKIKLFTLLNLTTNIEQSDVTSRILPDFQSIESHHRLLESNIRETSTSANKKICAKCSQIFHQILTKTHAYTHVGLFSLVGSKRTCFRFVSSHYYLSIFCLPSTVSYIYRIIFYIYSQ